MKTTIKQKFMSLALACLFTSANAQCPTTMSVGVVSNTLGVVQVKNNYDVTPGPTCVVGYTLTEIHGSPIFTTVVSGGTTTAVFSGVPNGVYNLCSTMTYSLCGAFPGLILNDCDSLAVTTSSLSPPPSSLCVAHSSFSIRLDSLMPVPGEYVAYDLSYGSGSLSYFWDFGDGSYSSLASPSHTYTTPGKYVVCLTVVNVIGSYSCTSTHCDSSSVKKTASGYLMSSITVKSLATAIKEQKVIKTLKTFPNPMTDELTIEIELTTKVGQLNYVISDALGKIALRNSISDSQNIVNTSSLEKGMYFLSIQNDKGETLQTSKLVK